MRLKLHLKAWRAILTKPSTIEKEYAAVAQVVVPIPRPAEIWREGWPQRPLSSMPWQLSDKSCHRDAAPQLLADLSPKYDCL